MGLSCPSGASLKTWFQTQLYPAGAQPLPPKLASLAASTLINGGKGGLLTVLRTSQARPSALLLHVADQLATYTPQLIDRLRTFGAQVPPMARYKVLGALIQRCESKVMLTALCLLMQYHPLSVLWLHDGIYLHASMNASLAQEICRKAAVLAGFPYLEFQLTPPEEWAA